MENRKLILGILSLAEAGKTITEMDEFYQEYLNVRLTDNQLIDEACHMDDLFFEVLKWGCYDTDIRERICDSHARRIMNRNVPTYGDGLLFAEEFWKELHKKQKSLGYEVIE